MGLVRYILADGRLRTDQKGTIGYVDDSEKIMSITHKAWRDARPPIQGPCKHSKSVSQMFFPSYERRAYPGYKTYYGFQIMDVNPAIRYNSYIPKDAHSLIFAAMANAKTKGVGTFEVLQLNKTYQTICDCIFKSKRFLLRKTDDLDNTVLLQRISDRWLEYRYALNPLIGAADRSIKNLIDMKMNGRVILKGQAKKSYVSQSGIVDVKGWMHTQRWYDNVDISAKAIAYYESKASKGFAFNPAAAIWDKVPWSFVVNWFVDVEAALFNLSPTWGLTFVSGSVGLTSNIKCELDSIIPDPACSQEGNMISFDVGQCSFDTKSFSRFVFNEQPDYYFNLEIINPLKWRRVLDSIALLTKFK
jgi:hypothetical protein